MMKVLVVETPFAPGVTQARVRGTSRDWSPELLPTLRHRTQTPSNAALERRHFWQTIGASAACDDSAFHHHSAALTSRAAGRNTWYVACGAERRFAKLAIHWL